MKRAIWPAGLVLLALVLSAAAPAPDVRAAPPRTVPHGDAARPRDPLPSALHGRPLGDGVAGVRGRVRRDELPRRLDRLPRGWPEGVRRSRQSRTGPCSIRTDSRSPRPEARGRQSPSTAPTTSSSGATRIRSSGRASIPAGPCSIPAGSRSRRGPTAQYEPTLAFDGTNYLVVWVNASPDERRLRRARVSVRDRARPRGDRDRGGAGFNEYSPSVAFDGTNYLVVWEEDPCHRILGRRVSQGGVPDGDGSFLISYCQRTRGRRAPGEGLDPQDGSCGRVRRRQLPRDLGLFLRRLLGVLHGHPGCPRDPREDRARPERDLHHRGAGRPVLAVGGLRRLDVSRRLERRGGSVGPASRPRASVLDHDGIVVSASWAQSPVDAFDGTNYLAVWDNQVDVFGTRVSQAGGVLDPGTESRSRRNGLRRRHLRRRRRLAVGRITIPEIGPGDAVPVDLRRSPVCAERSRTSTSS